MGGGKDPTTKNLFEALKTKDPMTSELEGLKALVVGPLMEELFFRGFPNCFTGIIWKLKIGNLIFFSRELIYSVAHSVRPSVSH